MPDTDGAFVVTAESVTDCARLAPVFSGETHAVVEKHERRGAF